MKKDQVLLPIEMTQDCFFAVVAGLFWIAYFIPALMGGCFRDLAMKLCMVGSLQYLLGIGFLFWVARFRGWPAINPSKMHPVDGLFVGVLGEVMLFPFLSIVGLFWQKILLGLRYVLDTDFAEQPLMALLRSGLTREGQFWAILFLTVILAPIAEEIFFRYFLYRSCKRKMPSHWALFVVALAFALLHFNLAAFMPLLVMGLFLGLCYERCGHLLPCIVLHGIHNYITIMIVLLFPGNAWL